MKTPAGTDTQTPPLAHFGDRQCVHVVLSGVVSGCGDFRDRRSRQTSHDLKPSHHARCRVLEHVAVEQPPPNIIRDEYDL